MPWCSLYSISENLLQPSAELARRLRADDARHDRHVVADHVVEVERRLGLIDQRRDVSDVDRLPDVGQLLRARRRSEELAEVLVLVLSLSRVVLHALPAPDRQCSTPKRSSTRPTVWFTRSSMVFARL